MKLRFSILLLSLAAAPAFAQQCEANFKKQGNALLGTIYSTSISMPGLSIDSALGQLRDIAVKKNMHVISEDLQTGVLEIEEPGDNRHKPLPFTIIASNSGSQGQVDMILKLGSGGVFSKAEAVKQEMCGMLSQVKSGKEGEKIASAARKPAAASTTVTAMTAIEFSHKLASEWTPETSERITPRYHGKRFRLTGNVGSISGKPGSQSIQFRIPLGLGDTTSIRCEMALDQTAYTVKLRKDDKIDLTGTFLYIEYTGGAVLKDCRGN